VQVTVTPLDDLSDAFNQKLCPDVATMAAGFNGWVKHVAV
jgi:hypothetical protein